MGVSTSEIVSNVDLGDGRRAVHFRCVDDEGVTYDYETVIDSADDVNTILTNRVDRLTSSLKLTEANRIIRSIRHGADPNTLPLYHHTRGQALAVLITEYRKTADVYFGLKVAPIVEGLTDQQLRNSLGVTQERVNAIRARVANLRLMETELNADTAAVEEGING